MSLEAAQKIYESSAFVSLLTSVNIGILTASIEALSLSEPPDLVLLIGPNRVRTVWLGTFPSAADVLAVDGAVASHTGGTTSGAPQQVENLGNVDATSGSFVTVFDVTTPPLDAGTYLVLVETELSMPVVQSNTAVQAEFRLGAGSGTLIGRTTVASATQPTGFDPHAMLARTAGQTIRVVLQIAKLGASAATARASNSRLSICKVA